ncbi:MAG: thermonuclease family protein [Gemmatimonadetes bacterium]|nr:thermonuclease family protein [Gemmatimonadota bacterium]
MRRTLLLTFLLLPLLSAPATPFTAVELCDASPVRGAVEANACCKVCSTGKACGDSCISRGKNCNKGRGCACNAGESHAPSAQAAPSSGTRSSATPQRSSSGAAAAAPAARASAPLGTAVCTIASVSDGDTVVCEGGERVRLLLIDTPEMSQRPFGLQAKLALEALLPVRTRAPIELDVQERDRYGRVLAYVYAPDGRMANEEMARKGYAVSLTYPPNVKHVERIRAAVEEARASRRGLWSTRAFECSPQDHRAGRCRR